MPTPSGPFTGRTIDGLARDLREGRTTSTALVQLALDAIAELDPLLNAFVTVDAAGARAAARRADDELAGGADRGPLHGVPVGVKDLIMVAGLPASMGSRHFAGVAVADAACVARLRQAGAVVIGKTNTHEFAYGPTGDRSAAGPSRNPWEPARMSGGSSGGSAVAVAAGMVPLALGTDTGGSVRIPAALCGVAGFKPAYGAIPVDGVFPLAQTFDTVGLLAGHERDCLIAYRSLVPAGALKDDGRPGRVAWLDPTGVFACDPQVARTVRRAVEAGTGPLEELAFPAHEADELRETFTAIQSSETAAVHADRLAEAPELFDPEVLERVRGAAEMPGWRYVRAMRARPRLAESVGALFGRHDVLALPTVPLTAPFLGQRATELDGGPVAVRAALLALTSMWNVVGFPALSVPAGTVRGLPVGLQLVCRPGWEHLLFETAALGRARHGTPPAG